MFFSDLSSRVMALGDPRRAPDLRHSSAEIASKLVEDLERLVPNSVAAFFQSDSTASITTRLAAGPRWRTAEQEAPAWLAPYARGLALAARTVTPLSALMSLGPDSIDQAPATVAVFRLPIAIQGAWWGTVLVLAPATEAGQPVDLAWVVGAYVHHLTTALDAVGPRLLADLLPEAEKRGHVGSDHQKKPRPRWNAVEREPTLCVAEHRSVLVVNNEIHEGVGNAGNPGSSPMRSNSSVD